MTDSNSEKPEQNAKKRPSYIAYDVTQKENGQAEFTKLGPAFAHRDGKGHNVLLEDRVIVLREQRTEFIQEGKKQPAQENVKTRAQENER